MNTNTDLVITECQIWPLRDKDKSRVKAMVCITFNHALRISGCRIIEGAKDLFLSYPSEKKPGSDQYLSLVWILDRSASNKVQDHVLERYNSFLEAAPKVSR